MERKVPFMKRKVHALSWREKFTHFHVEKSARTWEIVWLVHGISPTVFDPMVLHPKVLIPSIESMVLNCYGF